MKETKENIVKETKEKALKEIKDKVLFQIADNNNNDQNILIYIFGRAYKWMRFLFIGAKII